jgi:hypothetical protein
MKKAKYWLTAEAKAARKFDCECRCIADIFVLFMRLPCGHFPSLCCSGNIILTVTKCRVYAQTVSMKYLAKMESPDAFIVACCIGMFAVVSVQAERI